MIWLSCLQADLHFLLVIRLLIIQWHNKVFIHVTALTLPYQYLITALSGWEEYVVPGKAESSGFYISLLQEGPQSWS